MEDSFDYREETTGQNEQELDKVLRPNLYKILQGSLPW